MAAYTWGTLLFTQYPDKMWWVEDHKGTIFGPLDPLDFYLLHKYLEKIPNGVPSISDVEVYQYLIEGINSGILM